MLTPYERTLVVSHAGSPATSAFVDTVNLSLTARVPIAGAETFGDLAVMTNNGHYVLRHVRRRHRRHRGCRSG